MSWFSNDTRIIATIKEAVERIVKRALSDAESELAQVKTLGGLRQQIETLTIERDRKQEEFDRKEREVEHKIGLERKRQEFEITQAKREATVSIREENLKADRERFAEQLKFHEDRFSKEVGYLKEVLTEIVKRLPSAEFTADLGGGKRRGKVA